MKQNDRVFLAHIAYFEINLGIIWDIVQNDLPPLEQKISTWLK